MKLTAGDFLELTKPRLVLLAALAALVSFWMASAIPLDSTALGLTFIASFLVGAGASVFNQIIERHADSQMTRTRLRPLPAGRISVEQAACFGSVLAAVGLALLLFYVNPLSAFLGFLTLAAYLGVYTPLKCLTAWNTLAGAIPGALPCLIGWAAARNRLDPEAFMLFTILFVWQLPHFFAIAWVYRDEYRAAGFRMLSTVDPSGRHTAVQIVFFSALLVVVSFLPVHSGWAGPIYLVSALAAGIALVILAAVLAATKLRFARGFAAVSIYYLMVIMLGLAVDRL